MAYPSKAARNAALFADYRKGYLRRHLCSKYGLSEGGLSALLTRYGVKLPVEEKRRRSIEGRRRGSYRNVGRKAAWPNCPPEFLRTYRKLRGAGVPAAEARRVLDPGMQA